MNLLKIRGMIVGKYRTMKVFAEKIGYSQPQISKLFNGKMKWTQEIISDFINALDIPLEDVGSIFFG